MMKNFLYNYPYIGIGGSLGAIGRYFISQGISSAILSLLICNILGSFIYALAKSLMNKKHHQDFIALGFCGGLSTFSTFSKQTFLAIEAYNYTALSVLILGNILLCMLFILLGIWTSKKLIKGIN